LKSETILHDNDLSRNRIAYDPSNSHGRYVSDRLRALRFLLFSQPGRDEPARFPILRPGQVSAAPPVQVELEGRL
jgi:hypothetical protein